MTTQTTSTGMDINQFASDPSDPTWEPPRWMDTHRILFHCCHTRDTGSPGSESAPRDEGIRVGVGNKLSERAQALSDVATELSTLCVRSSSDSDTTLGDVRAFLERWIDPADPGRRVQPNVLVWLNDTRALEDACMHHRPDLVRLLLDVGLTVKSTAVSMAAKRFRETTDSELVGLLLDAGWDINEPLGVNGPLLGAVLGNPEAVSWCLSRGADPTAGGPKAILVMELAAGTCSLATLQALIDHGGRVTDGSLVAHASKSYGEHKPDGVAIVRFLLDRGAPVDAPYTWGGGWDPPDSCLRFYHGDHNALHYAVCGGKRDMVELLLARGADRTIPSRNVMVRNELGDRPWSPAELAVKYGHEDIARLLRE
ncbi:ankyrin repeat-containing domain protein [Xylariaceae sp. FL0804]|nr:ankyrin repeat-containing domain protein [Xylariaceae sp. FL0804]